MTNQRETSREVELKLAVPVGSAKAIAQHPLLQASQMKQRHEVSTYFDTPGQALAERGLILRVRRTGDRCVQTLKADARHGVAADRAEWEWPLIDDHPDPALLKTTPIAEDIPAGLEVAPVFATEIDRAVRILELEGAVAEAALDQGFIIAGERKEAVCELELELREGDPAELYRLAVMLHEGVPFTIASDSKAARGYRLKSGAPPVAEKFRPVALPAKTASAEVFRQIVLSALGHLLRNRSAALAGDPEGVHQMRVAVRRLRTALLLFKPRLEPHATARFENALRHLGRVFGEARDWDVFRLQVLPNAPEAAVGWHDLLEQLVAARRDAAYRRIVQELHEPPFTALALGLAAWAEQGRTAPGSVGHDGLQKPIENVCPQLLDRLARKVKKRGRHIDRSDADRHALRKSLKKLRYAIDYLQPLFPHKLVKSYLRSCKKLQRVLGDINDDVAATALADSLADETRPDLAPAIGALATRLARHRASTLQGLPKRWKSFSAEPRFWHQ